MKRALLLVFLVSILALGASVCPAQAPAPAPGPVELKPDVLFAKSSPAVVRVEVFDNRGQPCGQGSGFFISPGGVLVTSYDTVRQALSARVCLANGHILEVTGMLAALPECDLALLKVDVKGTDVPSLTLGIGRPAAHVPVYVVARPLKQENTLSQGQVAEVLTGQPAVRLRITQALLPGVAGAPVMDRSGRVVGVTSARFSAKEENVAVCTEHVHALTAKVGPAGPLPGTPPPLPDLHMEKNLPGEIFKRCSAAIVHVDVFDAGGRLVDQGLGFFVRRDGWLVTNYQLLARAHTARVTLADKKELPVKGMLTSLPEFDLALLKVDALDEVPCLAIGVSTLKRGASIFTFGTPAGRDLTFHQGTISRVLTGGGMTKFQLSIRIDPGASGGPMVNDWGNVSGVTSIRLSDHGQNGVVAVPHIHALLKQAGELAQLPGFGKPPVTPVQPPVTPVQPPVTPVQPPVTPVQPPVTPVQPPVTPVQPPVTPVQPPTPTPGDVLAPDLIFKRCSPAVVRVDVFDDNGRPLMQGSGFFIRKDGLLVTNYHVVKPGTSARVRFDDKRNFPVKGMVAALPKLDLVLLKVDVGATDVPALLVESTKPTVGTPAYAIGTPVGLANTFSQGIVSGIRTRGPAVLIQTTASITHGSSGGPLVSPLGRVIGVTSSGLGEANLNFAIAGEHVHLLIGNAGPLKPLPGAPANVTAPVAPPTLKEGEQVDVYTSLRGIADAMPKDMWPRYDPSLSRAHDQLGDDLRDKWIEKDLVGARLRMTSLRWANAAYEKSYTVYAGGGRYRTVNTPLLLVHLTAKEIASDGTTCYIVVVCGLENPTNQENADKAMTITARKRGSRVSLDGRIVAMLVKKGPETPHSREWQGVRRASRNIQLIGDPKTGTTFVDRKGVDVLIALDDWYVPARGLGEIAGRESGTDDGTDDAPDQKLTDEQKADRRLKTARLFISGIPQNPAMKDKAVEILKEILEDYPNTPAAAKADKELEKLEAMDD